MFVICSYWLKPGAKSPTQQSAEYYGLRIPNERMKKVKYHKMPVCHLSQHHLHRGLSLAHLESNPNGGSKEGRNGSKECCDDINRKS